MIRKLQFTLLIGIICVVSSCTTKKTTLRYEDFTKIDAHVHVRTTNPEAVQFAVNENFKFIMVCTKSHSQEFVDFQLDCAKVQKKQFPNDFAYTTTFSMEGFEDSGWSQNVINQLKRDFSEGAIGVKVWKDIGMSFRDSLGDFIMIDDPRFDPIFDFITQNNKIVVSHQGEPKNCWLPLDSMTVNGDRNYYKEYPQYHMYKHPDYPSYKDQIEARDNWLAKNPDLKIIGAHLGSLEWSVDELAKRLDLFPNFAVDMAARICHFQVQDAEKVKSFIIKYQDRLMYSTDFGIKDEYNFEEAVAEIKQQWRIDWQYFTTEDKLSSPRVFNKFIGLGLDEEVLRNIYYKNVIKWYPGAFK